MTTPLSPPPPTDPPRPDLERLPGTDPGAGPERGAGPVPAPADARLAGTDQAQADVCPAGARSGEPGTVVGHPRAATPDGLTAGARAEDRTAEDGPGATTGPQAPAGAGPDGGGDGGRRIEGLLLGLAAGDAAGWPAARHRASRMPEWTRRLTRELDTFAEQNATTTLPVPIALNQPPEPLRLGPSDDAEWAAFAAESVLTAAGALLSDLSRSRRMRAAIDLAWNALASEVAAAADRAPEVESAVLPLRARISVRAGLGNLAAGLRPPATGHDNPHYFDDAACVRACVLAVVHPGDPEAAADLAEFDARYTQDGDGVHGARAMAAAIATALAGAGTDAAVDAALGRLPAGTEIGRNARHAVALARANPDGGAFAIVPLLEHQIVDHVYSYGIAAAETVPVALALTTAARGRVAEAVPAAACLSRVADSAPALAGALTGALGGGDSIAPAWRDACRILSGCALPRLAGTDLVALAALLARTELTSPKTHSTHHPRG
ncbi:ADP-ribosylglycohydrolase family protein [Streptomyces sp. NBC_00536]|uniref:ADP-ribosylglycohydrolase family protein n=1 Tax=Streptomyces sp. NBC_00536 TaxID=2975769 RepID=UPI002E8083D2|nr:ADP-ribosylglycohydrolase family protein [Streptomyces sp. NBC_00536]WUC78524.1 ADP-ribosylglycohydrolase family protein [Streptomyces sp. NBC_00536]